MHSKFFNDWCCTWSHFFCNRLLSRKKNQDNVFYNILYHKEVIISHLSWVSLFLGFHTLGLYVHNDTCVAFCTPEKQILIEPSFAQLIQVASDKLTYGFDILLSSSKSFTRISSSKVWLERINSKKNTLFLIIGPGDFLFHHRIDDANFS